MFDNYPPGADMDRYFAEQAASDRFNAAQDDAINRALSFNPSTKSSNLSIVFDENDGEQTKPGSRIYPYPTYYNTHDPNFKAQLTNDLMDAGISNQRLHQFWQDAQDYEITDLLEELLPDHHIFSGRDQTDLDGQYIDQYSY